MPAEYFHHAELLVGDAHDTYMAFFREPAFDSFYMHIGIFLAAAMAHVDAELKHLETVSQNILSEFSIDFLVLLCFSGQIEKDKHPHNAICV